MIQFQNVCKSYGKTPVLKNVSFTIPDGQFVILIGPSGCGKTTTMKMINRLLEPDSGSILIDGKDIRASDKVSLRRHIGYVIQQIGLFPNMTVAQNICVVPKLLKFDRTRCEDIVRELLQMVDMESYADKYPSELSGGQQQRVLLARALCAAGRLLILDEPITGLDPAAAQDLYKTLAYLNEKEDMAVVMVTHDLRAALRQARTVLHIGRSSLFYGSTEEYLSSPQGRRFREVEP